MVEAQLSTIEQRTTYSFIVASGNDGRITAVEAGREDIGIVSLFQLNRRRHLSVIDTLPAIPDQHPPVVARRREGSLGVGESHRVHTAEVAEKSLAIETRAFQKTIGGYPTGGVSARYELAGLDDFTDVSSGCHDKTGKLPTLQNYTEASLLHWVWLVLVTEKQALFLCLAQGPKRAVFLHMQMNTILKVSSISVPKIYKYPKEYPQNSKTAFPLNLKIQNSYFENKIRKFHMAEKRAFNSRHYFRPSRNQL